TVPAMADAPEGYYPVVGYRLCGARAVRIDMLERLADLIRPLDVRAGFEATPDMLSITGCTLEQLADILTHLGFAAEKGERPKPVRSASPPKDAGAPPTPAETADSSASPGALETPEQEVKASEDPALAEPALDGNDTTVSEDAPETAPDPAAEAEPDDGAAPGETPAEQELEVFYTFTLTRRPRPQGNRPPGKRPQGDRPHRPRGKGPQQGSGSPSEGAQADAAEPGQNRRRGKGPKGKGKSKGAPGPKSPPQAKPKPHEKPIDPDSPFAILQQLKKN
ncbi:MAG: disulfide oxidoreductase, partial [Pseudomonadota bacterium]